MARVAATLPGASLPVPAGWAGFVGIGASTLAAVLLGRRRWFRRGAVALALVAVAWSVSGLVGRA